MSRLYFIPALLWAAVLFWVSAQETLPHIPYQFLGIDKLQHAAAYGILALLLLYGARWPKNPLLAWRWAEVAAFYGMTDEIHQLFVEGRSSDVLDLLADGSGALLCVACWLWIANRQTTRDSPSAS